MNYRFYLFIFLILASQAEAQKASVLAVADSLYAVGNYSEAIESLAKIQPKDESVYLKLARAHRAKGTLDDALVNYSKAASGTSEVVAMNEYGKLLITRGRFEAADSVFSALINIYDKNADFYYQRGRALENRKLPRLDSVNFKMIDSLRRQYITDYQKAVALDSTHQNALSELAMYYLKQKDYGKVEQLAFKALESYPANVEIIATLAQSYYYKGWNEETMNWFEKLLELGQDTQFIREKLGNAYYKEQMYKPAIEQYQEALRFSPQDWYLHHTLNKLYNFTQETEKAETHGLLAIQFKDLPLSDEYYTLARTFEIQKDWKKAMEYVNKALAENPDNKNAEYTKAIIADNYYADRRVVLKLYEDFIKKYENKEYAKYDPSLKLAKERAKILRRDIFMADDDQEK